MAKMKVIVKDPICGMSVEQDKAKKKGLYSTKNNKTSYFCSSNCKDKFEGQTWIKENAVSLLLSALIVVIAVVVFQKGYMLPFMGIVFLLLSGLKLLDVKGFVKMFSQYDLIASRSKIYAKVYPFIELGLGLSFIFAWQVKIAALLTVVIMGIGAIGVGKNLLSKNKIDCACLGTKIKVPLTTFTLVEDIVMVIMGLMILLL